MANKKKTLYEILEISPNASYSEIKAAHQNLTQQLHSERSRLSDEYFDFQLKTLNVAFHTLAVPTSRNAYDAKLAEAEAALPVMVDAALNPVAIQPNAEVVSLRAEAISLRAEAMSLRAEAMSLLADTVIPPKSDVGRESDFSKILAKFSLPIKKVLIFFGTLVALGMVIQVVILLFVNGQSEQASRELSKVEEKIFLQEFYQRTGIRAASRIEADLLEAERRRQENTQHEAYSIGERNDAEYERFVEESRRRGDEITRELRAAEQEARHEEERKQWQLEEEKRNAEAAKLAAEEAERERIARDLDKLRGDIKSSSSK